MKQKVKDLIWKVSAAVLLWALCRNRKLMMTIAKRMISELSLKELMTMSIDVRSSIKKHV